MISGQISACRPLPAAPRLVNQSEASTHVNEANAAVLGIPEQELGQTSATLASSNPAAPYDDDD
eukprot:397409-Pyramimonas_sp.AAC.1